MWYLMHQTTPTNHSSAENIYYPGKCQESCMNQSGSTTPLNLTSQYQKAYLSVASGLNKWNCSKACFLFLSPLRFSSLRLVVDIGFHLTWKTSWLPQERSRCYLSTRYQYTVREITTKETNKWWRLSLFTIKIPNQHFRIVQSPVRGINMLMEIHCRSWKGFWEVKVSVSHVFTA